MITLIYQANITISSNLLEIKNVVEDLLTSIKDIIKEENLLFDMKLILNELIINSAVHGNTLDENKKINLNLEILDKRPDNYHNLKSVFQKVNLYDELFIK